MKKILIGLSLLVFMVGSYGVYQIFIDEPEVAPYLGSYSFDVDDPQLLTGWSDNVFVGKVIKKIGEKSNVEGVEKTQYEVEVIENIKGDLEKTAVVSQFAGHRIVGLENFLVIQHGDELLQDGQTYLFAGRFEEVNGWIDLVPIAGNKKLETKEKQQEMSTLMKDAYENEIDPFPEDKKEKEVGT